MAEPFVPRGKLDHRPLTGRYLARVHHVRGLYSWPIMCKCAGVWAKMADLVYVFIFLWANMADLVHFVSRTWQIFQLPRPLL